MSKEPASRMKSSIFRILVEGPEQRYRFHDRWLPPYKHTPSMNIMRGLKIMLPVVSGCLARGAAMAFGAPPLARAHFQSATNNLACADVHLVPMFNDNYGLILVDRVTNKAAFIDPGESGPMIKAGKDLGSKFEMALITHKHGDHSGGNAAVKEAFPDIKIIATGYESIQYANQEVRDGDSIILGSLKIDVIHTPCHTKGHVVYYVSSNGPNTDKNSNAPILFSGDTLFVGGCGRFFEGTPEEMLNNMDRLGKLPHETQVYCAHEYTLENLKFLATIDPYGSATSKMLNEVTDKRKAEVSTVPTTIGRELEYNLFIKCREEATQSLVDRKSPVETMARLRELKNQFRSV